MEGRLGITHNLFFPSRHVKLSYDGSGAATLITYRFIADVIVFMTPVTF